MKKINKSFMIFTPLTLLGVASVAAVGTVLILNKGKNIQYAYNDNGKDKMIEKENILNSLDKYFYNNSSIKQMSYSVNNSISTPSSLNEFLKEKAKDFINRAYEKSEVNVLEDLKLEIAKAGYNYDEVIQKGKKDILNNSIKDNVQHVTSFSSSYYGDKTYQEAADGILKLANQTGIQAGIVSAIAAAQWAAAFFSFGATIATATMATVQAAALAAEAIVYRVQYNNLVSHKDWNYLKKIQLNNRIWNNIKNKWSDQKDMLKILFDAFSIVSKSIIVVKAITSATKLFSPISSLFSSIMDFIVDLSTFILSKKATAYK